MLKLEHMGIGDIFYATHQSAGFDICANETVTIQPKGWVLIKTGLRISESLEFGEVLIGKERLIVVPEIQIRPRSGLALKYGITVLNSPSTIDADYRGEIMVTLINHSDVTYEVNVGDRIAQGICALVVQLPNIKVKDKIRGEGGFGSTGSK